MRALLVDDEYLALELLSQYISQIPQVEVVAKVKSPVKALEILNREAVDLLFLDIQMPALSGVSLLKTLRHPPITIFTTAYEQYALDAFDLQAVDYLLKPFSFERFLQAVNKAQAFFQATSQGNTAAPSPPTIPQNATPLVIKVDGKLVKVSPDQILYIEGLREYIRIVCRDRKWITLESLKQMEAMLPTNSFMRVHKSYLVATEHVEALEGNQLRIGPHLIPISRSKREEVLLRIFGQDIS